MKLKTYIYVYELDIFPKDTYGGITIISWLRNFSDWLPEVMSAKRNGDRSVLTKEILNTHPPPTTMLKIARTQGKYIA